MSKNNRPFKRWLQLSDTHCGHLVGLTGPENWAGSQTKWGKVQRICWKFFTDELEPFKPFDVVHVNGDWITGKNHKSGSRELITADLSEQAMIGVSIIKPTECKIVRATRGTPYHTGSDENHEDTIIRELKIAGIDAKIKNHGFYLFNGKQLNVKHKIAVSSTHYGRLTPLAKEIDWNRIWHLKGVQSLADVLMRGHAHYYEQIRHNDCIGLILPSLQALGDSYGELQCSGTVDFGFIVIDVYDTGKIEVHERIMEGKWQKSEPERL